MSDLRRERPRRSVLALPASNRRFLEKAASLPADCLLLDLEDAVAPDQKEHAALLALEALRTYDYGDRVVTVRVNPWGSGRTLADLGAVVAAGADRLDAIALAKTQSPGEVVALDLVLADLERDAHREPGSIGIDVLIESAQGLASVEAILACSPRVWSVAIGRADLAASLHFPELVGGGVAAYPGDHFHFVLMKVLLAARVAGVTAIDGPYLALEDRTGLAELAARSAALGYDGKWAIHPSQLEVVNESFSPSDAEVERALEIVAALDRAATQEGRGALRDGGAMLDEASRKMALAVLARRRPAPERP